MQALTVSWIESAGTPDRVRDVERELLGDGGVSRLDVRHRSHRHRRHRARGDVKAVLDVERRPWRVLLVLRDARRVLGRVALGRLVELAGAEAERDGQYEERLEPRVRVSVDVELRAACSAQSDSMNRP